MSSWLCGHSKHWYLIFHRYRYKYEYNSIPWWRHQMETFSALLALCAGNSPVPGEFPAQRPVTRSFDVFFDLRLYKRLGKQSWGWWLETLSRPLGRHRNATYIFMLTVCRPLPDWQIQIEKHWSPQFYYSVQIISVLTIKPIDFRFFS